MTVGGTVVPPRPASGYFEIFSLNGQVHWRLLSRNNRNGGRSITPFPDLESCQLGIARLIEVIPQVRRQQMLTADNRWNWALLLGQQVLARSSQSFDRRIRCAAACEWFCRAAPLATIRAGQRVVGGSRPGRATFAPQLLTQLPPAAPAAPVRAADPGPVILPPR